MCTPVPASPKESLLVHDLNQNSIEQRKKLLRRFYEPLLLLETLRRAPQTPPKPIDAIEPTSSSTAGLRRSFVDGIAYLCAFERFSNCVTAAALEKSPQGLILWLAANGGVRGTTVDFLRDVLGELHRVAQEDAAMDRSNIAEKITPGLLGRVVKFGTPRLQKYVNNICNIDLRSCIQLMRQDQADGASIISRTQRLCDWLETTFLVEDNAVHQPQNLLRLVLDCYAQRKSLLFEPLQVFACQGGQHASDFDRLSLLLCKLGKHVTMTRKVVEATVYLCDDFREPVRVATLRSSAEKALPLTAKEGTVASILGRVFASKIEMNEFKVRLQSLWNSDEIEAILSRERPSKTKVHAELLVADHFYRNSLQFLGGHDRYIGCSKPTCYLCDAYLRNHPAGFAVPRSHQKIYTAWRCPDVFEDDPNSYQLHQAQEKLLLELINWVRKDLKKEVESRTPRAAIPPDSTAGITSENHPVLGPFALSKIISMLNGQSQVQDSPQGKLDFGNDDGLEQKEAGRNGDAESDDGDGGVRLP